MNNEQMPLGRALGLTFFMLIMAFTSGFTVAGALGLVIKQCVGCGLGTAAFVVSLFLAMIISRQ